MNKVSNPFLKFHVAEVIDIDDPDQNGRSKLRITGQHDDKTNVPDKDLPWGVPMLGSDNPAINKIGSSGNGLLKGSKVLVTFWDMGQGHQQPIILGSIGSSGKSKSGSTQNSTTEIDKTKSDSPTASRNKDGNPVVDNQIKDSKTTPGSKDDSEKNIYNETRKKAKFKDTPSIGSSNTTPSDSVLKLIKQVDPENSGGSVKKAVESLLKLEELNATSTPSGMTGIASKVLSTALLSVGKLLTNDKVFNQLNGAMTVPVSSEPKEVELLQKALFDIMNNHDKTIEEILVNEPDDIKTIIQEILDVIHNDLKICIQNETLTREYLITLIRKIIEYVNQKTTQKNLGCQEADAAGNAAKLIPIIGQFVTSTLNDFLPKSVLDQEKIKTSLNKFTKNQALLDKKKNILQEMFSGNKDMTDKLSGMNFNFNFNDPATGKKLNG